MDFAQQFQHRLGELKNRDPFLFDEGQVPSDFSRAAVLLPFWQEDGAIKMTAFVRPNNAPTHAGQVAFPGGRCDANDDSLIATALREAQEELGIEPDSVAIVGQLDDAWSAGKFHVSSFVGWLETPPQLVPCPEEVELAVVADVEPLFEPVAKQAHEVSHFGRTWVSHAFELPGARLYGFSASLFIELMDFVEGRLSDHGPARLNQLEAWVAAGMPPWSKK
jgi:8-oxo-dGTP pyrophosphatase MutT (NUDIX family)